MTAKKPMLGQGELHGETVYYEIMTKNSTFLEVVSTLKEKNIKNNKLPLILYDRTLAGIDPWSKKVAKNVKLQAKIMYECTRNYWYFIRNVVKVPVAGGLIPYTLHRGNLAQSFTMLNNLKTIIMLPRQHYKTQTAVIVYLWQILFTASNYNYIFSHKAVDDAKANLKRLQDMIDCVPKYLSVGVDKNKDNMSKESMHIKSSNNSVRVIGPAADKAGADKAGRGMTTPAVWLDELAFIKYNKYMYDSMVPAFSEASRAAEANGTPYGILITTTPSNLDTDEGSFCNSLMEGAYHFDEKLYDLWYEKGGQAVKMQVEKHSLNSFVYIIFSYDQLGKDEEWLREQTRALGGDLQIVKREIHLQWVLASNTSPFSEDSLDNIEPYVVRVEDMLKIYVDNDNYFFHVIKKPSNMMKKNYIISVDVAGGLGRDSSVITVIDPKTMESVMLFRSNIIPITKLKSIIIELITRFLPAGVLIIERNNSGIALIQMLLETSVKKNMYYTVMASRGVEKVIENERPSLMTTMGGNNVRKKTTLTYGMTTVQKNREIMVDEILFMVVNEQPFLVNNPFLLGEIKTLQRKANNKIEHANGKHDDVVMSYLIGLYPLLYDTNISKFVKVTYDYTMGEKSEAEKEQTNNNIQAIQGMSRAILSKDNEEHLMVRENYDDVMNKQQEMSTANKISKFGQMFKR